MGKISVTLQHVKTKAVVDVDDDGPVGQLMDAAWTHFSVPLASQKIIFKGKTLALEDTIGACGLKAGAKVVVMGTAVAQKDWAPTFAEHEARVVRITETVEAAVDKKQLLAAGEECDGALAALDALDLTPQDTAARDTRREYVRQYQKLIDAVEAKCKGSP